MNLRYSTKAARTAAALFFAGAAAAACTGAAQAQNALIPPALTVPRHVPARLPQPGSAQPALPLAANGTFIPGPSLFSGARTAWMQPHASSVAAFGLSPFSSVGPSTILDAGGGVGVAYQPVAGRVVAIAPDPTNSSIIYIAAAGGGVWKTTDGGGSWTALTDGLPDLAMGSLTVDPSSPSTIYAGSGEANFAGDSRYGEGLYKSTNGGASWTVYTGPNNVFAGLAISKIVVDPTNSGVVYLTTARAANGTRTGYGVYKSTDGGASWALVFDGGTSFTDLAIDPSNTQTLYAAGGEIGGNTNNGIYKSTNGGASWPLLTGFPNGKQTGNLVGRISLALAPSNPQVLYADYSSSDQSNKGANFGRLGGFFSTQNGGATWTAAPKSTDGTGSTGVPNFLGGQGWYDNTIVVNPTNASEVFAAGVVNYATSQAGRIVGLIGSFDGGNTWYDYSVGHNNSGPHTDHHALAFTPGGSALLNGNDGGMWRLENPNTAPNTYDPSASSVSWSNLNTNLAITQFTGIALHPTDATIAYGGSQDNGTEKMTGSTQWTQVRPGDGGFTRVDQTNPQTVYHEYYDISLERSDDGGATWNGKGTGINPNDPTVDGSDPAAFYVPYVLDPANQSRVVYGTDHVYESMNKGDAFTAIGTPGANGFNTADNTIDSIATLGNTVYASAGGTLYATSNDGATWAQRTLPAAFSIYDSISDIYVNPNTALDVIITKPSFGGGHVFRSNNGGATFKDISGNLPNEPFNAVKVDRRSGTMYAGADDGVYTTTNFGGTWVKSNLPNVQVVDLAVSRGAGIVGAGTHGRGMFEASLPTTVATPNLIVNAALSRAVAGGPVTITLTLKDINNADETNTVVSTVTLNNQPAVVVTPGTDTVGTVPAQGQAPTVAYQSATPPASGTRAVLRVTGTSTQGNFTASLKVMVP